MTITSKIKTYIELEFAFTKEWKRCGFKDDVAYFRGKIDLLQVDDEKAIVTDWKTNRVIMPQSAIDASFQLDVYAYVVSLLFPQVKEITVNLFFARYGATRTSERNLAATDRARKKIERLTDKIEATKGWTAHVASHCEYCEYTGLCTQYQKAIKDLNIEEITTPGEAKLFAKKVFLVEAFLAAGKKKLKAYVDIHGGLEVDDEKLDYWATQSTTFPKISDLAAHLISEGHSKEEVYGVLSTSKTALGKLFKKDKEALETVIEKFGAVETSTRFQFKKVKGEE